jgi:hypothetical protein
MVIRVLEMKLFLGQAETRKKEWIYELVNPINLWAFGVMAR